MKAEIELKYKKRISSSHRNILKLVWKIHHGMINNIEDKLLKKLVVSSWHQEIKNHLISEEIKISSGIEKNTEVINKFFHYHMLLRKRIANILDANNKELKNQLELLCILIIEMVKYEERQLK